MPGPSQQEHSSAPLRVVSWMQFGILSPDEIVRIKFLVLLVLTFSHLELSLIVDFLFEDVSVSEKELHTE